MIPKYENFDWRNAWVELQKDRGSTPSSDSWDARAESFAKRNVSSYTTTFLEFLKLEQGQSVLDMGCGTGEIALALAKQGHKVLAVDFSDGMLGYLKQYIHDDGVEDLITPIKASWSDSWEQKGIYEKSVDVAIASRSIMVDDLGEAIDKLSASAKVKVAVTLSTGCTPSEDRNLLSAIGRKSVGEYDVPYCFNILYSMGYRPEIRYIDYDKDCTYASLDEAVADMTKRIKNITPNEMKLARDYAKEVLKPIDPNNSKAYGYTLEYKRVSKWAFISWEV